MVAAGLQSDRPPEGVVPRWTPTPAALDDLEMILLGAFRPLTGFLGQRDAARVVAEGRLEDGTPWPLPVVLEVPADVEAAASIAGRLRLDDEEGAPIAEIAVTEAWTPADGGRALAGPVRPLGPVSRGAYPELRRAAGNGREQDRPLLAVPLTRAPDDALLAAVRARADELGADVLLTPLVGAGRPGVLDSAALVRVSTAVRDLIGPNTQVLPLPLRADADAVVQHVASAYGAKHVVTPPPLEDPASATYPPAVERELRRARRATTSSGIAVLLTGLSGSGKSTIARALHQALLERTDRTVSMLDGDVVRRMLSSELGFSREHRELNVRRIGYVAAEVVRHGGIAICAPIAPYAGTRAEFRSMVESFGQLLLVHVSTPLEVCESRDRKGLYAKARAGLIEEFTGISDPYEVPDDADLRIDTSQTSVEDAVNQVLAALLSRRLIELEDVA